ncbi:MAG: AzlD domain-containing protein [Ruminococcaceae bacterium]|nr:AzlD domain-containing protein [Oscillospiraceae bacterium]
MTTSVPMLLLYTFVMAAVTYLIRMLPLVVFRKPIQNRFIKSFLYYVPYAVLGAMTFPAILYSTSHLASAAVGLAVSVILAWFGRGLLTVAVSACAAVYLTEWLMLLL